MSSLYLLYVMVCVVSSYCKATGRARPPMTMAIFTILLARIFYLSFYPQTTYMHPIISYPVSWALTSIAYTTYYLLKCKIKEND